MSGGWKTIVLVVVISFLLGMIFDQWKSHCDFHRHWKKRDHAQWMLKKLNSKLGLSQEQKKKIEAILEEARPRVEAIHSEMWPKFDAIRQSVHAQIRPLLNDRQQKKFEEMEAEWEARMKDFRGEKSTPVT